MKVFVPWYVNHVLKNAPNMIMNTVKNVQRLAVIVQKPAKKWLVKNINKSKKKSPF